MLADIEQNLESLKEIITPIVINHWINKVHYAMGEYVKAYEGAEHIVKLLR